MILSIFLCIFSFSFGFLLLFFITFRVALHIDELENDLRRKQIKNERLDRES